MSALEVPLNALMAVLWLQASSDDSRTIVSLSSSSFLGIFCALSGGQLFRELLD